MSWNVSKINMYSGNIISFWFSWIEWVDLGQGYVGANRIIGRKLSENPRLSVPSLVISSGVTYKRKCINRNDVKSKVSRLPEIVLRINGQNLFGIVLNVHNFGKKGKQLSEQQSSTAGLFVVCPGRRRHRTFVEIVDFTEGKNYHLRLLKLLWYFVCLFIDKNTAALH